MYNLLTNYQRIFQICKDSLNHYLVSNHNFTAYRYPAKMSDLEVISLSITAEVLGIGSENLLFSILKTDYKSKFPHLIHRTNYNRRRRKLQPYISQVAQRIGQLIDPQPSLYILDSIPLPICQPIRIPRCKINKNDSECLPSRGYHASHKQYYYGDRRADLSCK